MIWKTTQSDISPVPARITSKIDQLLRDGDHRTSADEHHDLAKNAMTNSVSLQNSQIPVLLSVFRPIGALP